MKRLFQAVFVLILVGMCAALVGGVVLADRLPRLAREKFGPPGNSLGLSEKVIYSYRLLASQELLLSPLDPAGEPRPFTIEMGEPVDSIAYRLEAERLIPSAEPFLAYLVYAGLDTRVQAGEYRLSPSLAPVEIARQLLDAVPEDVAFVILPGWRMEEVSAALPTSGLQITEQEFLYLARNPPAELLPSGFPPLTSLEGFLMPGSYQVNRGTSARGLLELLLGRFDQSVTQELRGAYAANGLDLFEAVTLASIVQREAVVADEQALIASVFYNRLAIGMRLESDPTAQYALGYQLLQKTWWKNPLSGADLRVNSSYNTYVTFGLPPGPISNPALEVLRAVAYPEQSGYYYFRARCDGSGRHFFAVTYEEHLQNACP